MVVIGIMGVIVGVAAPSYDVYRVRGRVATVLPVMQNYAELGREYYETNGKFGNAYWIGLNTSGQTAPVLNPTSINKYTSAQSVGVDGASTTGSCYNNIRFTLSGTALGIAQDFDIQMLVRNVNGQYQITCGIPFDQTATTYAAVLQYFPESCQQQNVSTC